MALSNAAVALLTREKDLLQQKATTYEQMRLEVSHLYAELQPVEGGSDYGTANLASTALDDDDSDEEDAWIANLLRDHSPPKVDPQLVQVCVCVCELRY